MMPLKNVVRKSLYRLRSAFIALVIFQFSFGALLPAPMFARDRDDSGTETPIKHLIVLIGENRTFDHVFATYIPKSNDSISNLLSKEIINSDGTPGPNFSKTAQFQAVKPFQTKYFISLTKSEKTPYSILPAPTLNFAPVKTI